MESCIKPEFVILPLAIPFGFKAGLVQTALIGPVIGSYIIILCSGTIIPFCIVRNLVLMGNAAKARR